MRILFINLSDPGTLGKKSGEALEKKHKPSFFAKDKSSKVTVLNLMTCALQFADSGTITLDQQTSKTLQDWLSKRKKNYKIIIAAHGKVDDTDYCYAESDPEELFKTHKLLNYAQLATFVKSLLAMKGQKMLFNMTLSICYSARSQEHGKHHIRQLAEIDIRTSFAAKFYALLVTECNLRLKAVTGSVEFDEITGSLLVESEEAIEVMERYDSCLRELKRFEQKTVQPLMTAFIDTNGYDAWEIYLRDNNYKKQDTPLDKVWALFIAIQDKYEELRKVKTQLSQKHYGQIVFHYDPQKDTVTISLKHKEKQTTLKVIKRDDFVAYYSPADQQELLHGKKPSPAKAISDEIDSGNAMFSNHKA
ncbi:TPA: hypothetical protein ACPSKE_002696 [Legionella feeleii]